MRGTPIKIILLFMMGLVICSGCGRTQATSEPDAVSSMRINREENLIVVANRDNIEDKEEFARLLMEKFKENSFHTIKFMTDYGEITSVEMRVYFWKEDVKDGNPVMVVEYKPEDMTKGYDIENHPEAYHLYIDEEMIE